jgi:hypothetical protein
MTLFQENQPELSSDKKAVLIPFLFSVFPFQGGSQISLKAALFGLVCMLGKSWPFNTWLNFACKNFSL